MSSEDRLAFVEGKKAELNVWEVELHPEKVTWERVMKARFSSSGPAMEEPKHGQCFRALATQICLKVN